MAQQMCDRQPGRVANIGPARECRSEVINALVGKPMGIYSVFIYPDVVLTRAIEVPKNPAMRFHEIITVALGEHGMINDVINDTGEATVIRPRIAPKITDFP